MGGGGGGGTDGYGTPWWEGVTLKGGNIASNNIIPTEISSDFLSYTIDYRVTL